MNFYENIKMALDSIRVNKLRSFLTMLGIIIGISSVIAIISLGRGGQNTITKEFEKIGAATINIKVNSSKAQPGDYITLEDVRQIKEKVEAVKFVSPLVQKQGIIVSDKKGKRAFISGGNQELADTQGTEMLYGRFFIEREAEEGSSVVIIDDNAARSLFGYVDVVGKDIKLGSKSSIKKATIIGVSKGFNNPFGDSEDNGMPMFISTPITFMRQLFPTDFAIDGVVLTATAQSNGEEAGNSAKNILESRHNNRGKDIYIAENALKQLEEINKILGIFTAFIGAVAAISLLVGGIGVMNIMLVSVTERTREIGIRKAVGATTNIILMQFLTESVIISLIGGIIGMLLGVLGAEIIGVFARIRPSISPAAVITAILFSSAVGIFFGIYPARKAARLNPIDALRYE